MITLRKAYIAICHDIIMAALSFVISLYLRLGSDQFSQAQSFLVPGTLIFTATCAVIFLSMGLYRGLWRYASMDDLMALTKAVTLSILVFLPVMFLYNRLEGMPRSMVVINWFILLALLGGPRFFYRMIKDKTLMPDLHTTSPARKIPVLLAGLSNRAEAFIRETMGKPDAEYQVVGILDDDKNHIGRKIRNVEILGTLEALPQVIEKLKKRSITPQKIVITPGKIKGVAVKELLAEAESLGLTVARLPRRAEINNHLEEKMVVKPIAVEDLLGRPQNTLNRESMKELIQGNRVLVTGAGGTIGGELCRQIASYRPNHLVLLDISEHNLYLIDRTLREHHPDIAITPVIGDVRDSTNINRLFAEQKPDLIFHAAALKHVPMSEINMEEAILTNALGTKNVIDSAVESKVRAVVIISTDKAVNPTNVMGRTKRIAEIYTQAMSQSSKSGHTALMTVRFGNVLGSTGSVVPLFRHQLAKGGPLTVTHPEVNRYFMTVKEAVELVLQASVLGVSRNDYRNRIFVLDMGEPVLIKDLAAQMIRLAGLQPDVDIKIEYTGLRAGEKLFEELFYPEENPVPSEHESILLAATTSVNLAKINKQMKRLHDHALSRDKEKLMATLQEIVPG